MHPGRRMICSPGRSYNRTLRQSLLVGHEQVIRTRLSRQAHTQDAELVPLSLSVEVLPSAPTMYLLLSCAACSMIHGISG